MAQPKKKLRSWRVSILRQRARYIGTVKAPDERTAEAAAVVQFGLDDEQRRRLAVREEETIPPPALLHAARDWER